MEAALAPRASALPASILPAANSAPAASASGAAAQAAPALSASAQIASIAPGEYQYVREDQQGAGRWEAKAVALFDGMLERPRPLAVDGAESGDRLPELERPSGNFKGPHVFVTVAIKDPGQQGFTDAVKKLNERTGFRLDIGGPIVQAPGVVVMRGAVPAEQLESLSKAEGVVSVSPLIVRRFAPAKPMPETTFRAFVRKQAEKSVATGILTTFPLHGFAMPLLVFPLFTGLVMTFPPALAFLKPVLLAGGGAALATFTPLSALFRWVPASMRAALTYGAVVVGGSLLSFYGTPFVGLWVAVNGLLGMVAARNSFLRLAQSPDQTLSDKVVNSAETALHANLVGGQLLLLVFSSFIGGWMLPALLLAATALTLLALSRATEAPEPALTPATPPSAPNGAPEPEKAPTLNFRPAGAPKAKNAAKREPFIPASVKVTKLEKLAQTDVDAAVKEAAGYLLHEADKRPEVRISAVRVLSTLPAEKAMPVFIEYLGIAAKNGVQISKQTGMDRWWYYQWEILRGVAKDAAKNGPASEALLAALKAAYKDWNPSVRLMAGHALRAYGQDPGPETDPQPQPDPAAARPEYAPGGSADPMYPNMPHRASPDNGGKKPGSAAWKWLVGLSLGLALIYGLGAGMAPSAPQDPQGRPAVTAPADPAAQPEARQAPAGRGNAAVRPPAAQQQRAAAETPEQVRQRVAAYVAEQLKSKTPDQVSLEELHRIAEAAAEQQNRDIAEARARSGGFGAILMSFLPMLLMIGIMIFLFRKMSGGAGQMSVGQANTAKTDKPTTRFHDVAGIDESMVEVEEIVDYLRNPAKYVKLGARVPKGVLLEGPPGTGKTLLAKALAGETDANFISMSGSDFVQMFVGVGASRVRDLFEKAKQMRPAVIFIDEIDAVGKQRGSGGLNGGNDEREQTINAMLAAMDGFSDSTGIIVVAATNRADMLDSALTRPGRFDRKIHVGLPEALGREAILALHARKVRLGPDADLKYIARRTTGLSGAFLENVVQEAARLAARRGAEEVSLADLDEGVDRATIGAKRSLKLSDTLKLRIARHESGHVLANLLNEDPALRQPTNKVTIVPHGTGALGFAEIGNNDGDTYLYTKRELEARLDHAMGGLVAEKLYYGEWSTGPGSDLQYATRIARTMVQQLGMDEGLGFPQTGPEQNDPFGRQPFGDAIGLQVHEAVKKIIQESYTRVLTRFNANRHRLDAMSAALMEKETLIDSEIKQFAFGDVPVAPPQDGEAKK
jgi:cell division protease FtsH